MGRTKSYSMKEKYVSIGFVYPTYFTGIPIKVEDFISKLDFDDNKTTYLYAVTTYGEIIGNALRQFNMLLIKKGIQLSYGNKIKMFLNYIVFYNMSKKVEKITRKSDVATIKIIDNLKNKKFRSIRKPNKILEWYYKTRVKSISTMDKDYSVSDDCISCGICKKVCPVENIDIKNGKPVFKHSCEQCVACIQYCPKFAINYKNIIQGRRRYTNPSINYKELNVEKII